MKMSRFLFLHFHKFVIPFFFAFSSMKEKKMAKVYDDDDNNNGKKIILYLITNKYSYFIKSLVLISSTYVFPVINAILRTLQNSADVWARKEISNTAQLITRQREKERVNRCSFVLYSASAVVCHEKCYFFSIPTYCQTNIHRILIKMFLFFVSSISISYFHCFVFSGLIVFISFSFFIPFRLSFFVLLSIESDNRTV